jgi:REP element-mobilizing transposase RayT
MPRKPRIEFEGAFYHVITRGNQRQTIFRDPADYAKYLQILTIYKNRYHYRLYAYALMGNHVHLLIETGETPLSQVLQGINQSFTLYFNRRYKTVGHLFQGRYKAILCDRDNYLLALLKYIHQNPLRAGVAENLDSYQWSSHQAYTEKRNPLSLVDVDQVLRMFSDNKARARKHYYAFMDDGEVIDKNSVYATVDQRVQGDEEFVDRVLEKYDGNIKKEPKKKEYTLSAISRAVEAHFAVSLDRLRSSAKEHAIMRARRVLTMAAKAYGYRGRDIAEYLKKDPASVSGYLQGDDLSTDVMKIMRHLDAGRKNVNSKV